MVVHPFPPLLLGLVGSHDPQISSSTPHVISLFIHISLITMGLMRKNTAVYTINCLDSSCQFPLIAKILIAICPIARILIAQSTIAKILIAKSNNCQNTDCPNTDCQNTDCLNKGESKIVPSTVLAVLVAKNLCKNLLPIAQNSKT